MIRLLPGDDTAIEITEWYYDTSVCQNPDLGGVEGQGGFLREVDENGEYCFGYNFLDNAKDADGDAITFLQWQLCPEDDTLGDLLNFCWFGESVGTHFVQLR